MIQEFEQAERELRSLAKEYRERWKDETGGDRHHNGTLLGKADAYLCAARRIENAISSVRRMGVAR